VLNLNPAVLNSVSVAEMFADLGDRYQLQCPRLPLAVYREIAAHLQLLPGVSVTLLPQRSPDFDYLQSQVGGLAIVFTTVASPCATDIRAQSAHILSHYAKRFGPWFPVAS
jgi:hypothetical protein